MTTPANHIRYELARERDWATSQPIWFGRKGRRNRRVLFDIYNLAIRAGTRTISFSCRQIAERVAINKETASLAVWDLHTNGWLTRQTPRRRPPGERHLASTYLVGGPGSRARESERFPYTTPRSGEWMKDRRSSVRISLTIWDSDGLGSTAGQVHGLLALDSPTTVGELAEWTGLHPQTVRKALRALEDDKVKLARRDGRKWFRTELDPDEVGRALGAGDRRQVIKVRNAKEREEWQQWLEGTRERGTDPYYRPRTKAPRAKPGLPTASQVMDAQLDQMRDEDREEPSRNVGPSIRDYYDRRKSA